MIENFKGIYTVVFKQQFCNYRHLHNFQIKAKCFKVVQVVPYMLTNINKD